MSDQEKRPKCLWPIEHKYRLVKCENERDTYRCEVCGNEYERSCTFDEDYQ